MIKRNFLVLIIFLAFFHNGFTQPDQNSIDSLKKVLGTLSDDSLKVKTLIELSYALADQNLDESNLYGNQALEIATKRNWDWAKSTSYTTLGFNANSAGDFYRSLEYNNLSLKINMLGNDSSSIATSYNNVGNGYFEVGEYEEAYFYIKKAYELSKSVNDDLGAAIALHNLARLYARLGRMDLALAHFTTSATLSEKAKDNEGPAYNNLEIGIAYLQNNDHANALKYLAMARAVNEKLKLINLTPQIYQEMGKAYYESNDFDKALKYYDSALQNYRVIKNSFGEAETNLDKSKVFMSQKSFADATKLATESLATAQKLKAQRLTYESYQVLSQIEEYQGDFRNALKHNKQAQQTRDSLTSIDIMSQVFENEYQMRSQKKDQEIENLRKMREQSMSEIKRQQFIRNIFAVVFGLTMVLLYSVYKSGRRKVEINDLLLKHQQETEKRTLELEELNKVKDKFFSIISHDLRSPINSLAGLLDLMEKDQIKAEELPALTREMRVQFNHTKNLINNLLDWTLLQMNKVAIKKEKLSIKSIVDENIKLLASMSTKHTNFINEVGDDIQALADNNMINLIVRNLILNGIKFSDNGGLIKIGATRNDKEITLSVSDNGVGISDEVQKVLFEKTTGYSTRGTANEKGTGLGLILCKEFIERNGGKIWLESKVGQGSTFYVTMPVA
jgi:signal transduction histidine kinase